MPHALLEPPATHPVVVAHRGSSGTAPQNTLAAFEAAVAAGARVLEIDLHLSADGVPVVMHDPVVDATTDGTGALAELTLAELRTLDAGGWFAPRFAGQRIPTLDEVLDLLGRSPGMDLLCEYKGLWSPDEAAVTLRAIRDAGLADRTMVQSFRPATVAALREIAPDVPRSLLVEHPPADLVGQAVELGAVAVSVATALVAADDDLVARCRDAGLRVVAWTANDAEDWAMLTAAGVDAIITDHPSRLRAWLASDPRD